MKILIVEDESLEKVIEPFRDSEIYTVSVAKTLEEAKASVADQEPEIVVLDFKFPRVTGGAPALIAPEFMEFLKEMHSSDDMPSVILITRHNDVAKYIEKIRDWRRNNLIEDIVFKLVGWDLFQEILQLKVAEVRIKRTARPRITYIDEVLKSAGIVGKSAAIRDVGRQIAQCAPSNAPVLILGETGTGKELVAQAVHRESKRTGDFVELNTPSIPTELLESELYGHVEGAFSDAKYRPGRFVTANRGTLFLDELRYMSPKHQSKLLKTIEDMTFYPVGSDKPVTVDVRIVAATDGEPAGLVESGQLLDQLYFRLIAFVIKIPPLRERQEDVPLLANYFLQTDHKTSRRAMRFSPEALELMAEYHWRGNVRQLKSVVHGLSNEPNETITAEHVVEAINSRAVKMTDRVETNWRGVTKPLFGLEAALEAFVASSPRSHSRDDPSQMFDEFNSIVANLLLDNRQKSLLRAAAECWRPRPPESLHPKTQYALQLLLILTAPKNLGREMSLGQLAQTVLRRIVRSNIMLTKKGVARNTVKESLILFKQTGRSIVLVRQDPKNDEYFLKMSDEFLAQRRI